MELTDNILWLLKQAFYFSLTSVNEAVSGHGVSTAQIGVLRQLANEPGLSGAELARRLLISPQGVQLALTALERRGLVEKKAGSPARADTAGLSHWRGTKRRGHRRQRRNCRAREGIRRTQRRRAADLTRTAGPHSRKRHRTRAVQRPRRHLTPFLTCTSAPGDFRVFLSST